MGSRQHLSLLESEFLPVCLLLLHLLNVECWNSVISLALFMTWAHTAAQEGQRAAGLLARSLPAFDQLKRL